MIKHLPGRHNQQSHAGQLSPDDAFIEAAQSIPSGILGRAKVRASDYNPDLHVISFNSVNCSCTVAGNEVKINIPEHNTEPDILDALIAYATQFSKTYGPPHSYVSMSVASLKLLPVLQKHNATVYPENIDNTVSDAVLNGRLPQPDDTFATELYNVLSTKHRDIQASVFTRKVEQLRDEWLALPTTASINSLNIFGLYKIQKALAAKITVKARLDV